jgi:glutathione S-transferase
MTSTNYKLTYFNGRGRAELIRLVFAVAGVKYEDVRLEREQWPTIKPTTPFGQVPILEVDDVKLCQSIAIARYLARKFNLAGTTELDQVRVDMVGDCIEDTIKPLPTIFRETDDAKKAELVKNFIEEHLPKTFVGLENILKTNDGGDGFFVGSALTWADLSFFVATESLERVGAASVLSNYPKLVALQQRVRTVPQVAEWLAKRPVTPF